MAIAHTNGIDVFHDTFGDPTNPTLLMVSGLGAQMIVFEEALCSQLAELGFHVVRYDNRDVGLSTHLSGEATPDLFAAFADALSGGVVESAYTLGDMAADGMGLLDHLGVQHAHVVGTSMGGMIAQTMAIEHPERVRSLTSVMSTTGEPEYGMPAPDCLAGLGTIMVPAHTRQERIDGGVALAKLIGTDSEFDLARVTQRCELQVDRAYDPDGVGRQMMAILASGSRADGLATLSVPTMVMHGDSDRLIDISGGRRTAELVPGAEFRALEGMGHDAPPSYWPQLVDGISAVASRAE